MGILPYAEDLWCGIVPVNSNTGKSVKCKICFTAKDWLSAHLFENSVSKQHLKGLRSVMWKANNFLILNKRVESLKDFSYEDKKLLHICFIRPSFLLDIVCSYTHYLDFCTRHCMCFRPGTQLHSCYCWLHADLADNNCSEVAPRVEAFAAVLITWYQERDVSLQIKLKQVMSPHWKDWHYLEIFELRN